MRARRAFWFVCFHIKHLTSNIAASAAFNSSFILTLRLASISAAKFEPIYKRKIKRTGRRIAAIIEGKNYELICRNESGYRRGDGLGRFDRGRYGPRLAKADPNS
jgi:hypothetical protein